MKEDIVNMICGVPIHKFAFDENLKYYIRTEGSQWSFDFKWDRNKLEKENIEQLLGIYRYIKNERI